MESGLNSIPDELVEMIFSRLSYEEARALAGTCQRMRRFMPSQVETVTLRTVRVRPSHPFHLEVSLPVTLRGWQGLREVRLAFHTVRAGHETRTVSHELVRQGQVVRTSEPFGYTKSIVTQILCE